MGQRRLGEEAIQGDYCFGPEAQHRAEAPNRDLLVEFCCSSSLSIALPFLQNPVCRQVTYHELTTKRMDPLSEDKFAVLGMLLLEKVARLATITSDRLAAFASLHFPVIAVVQAQVAYGQRAERKARKDWSAPSDPEVRGKSVPRFPFKY